MNNEDLSENKVNYLLKLYALLHDRNNPGELLEFCQNWECFKSDKELWQRRWQNWSDAAIKVADSSDKINFEKQVEEFPEKCSIKHTISAQNREVDGLSERLFKPNYAESISKEKDAEKVFWWCWRFLPELFAEEQSDALLLPAHLILPDCPIYSYRSTVSALTAAISPDGETETYPYLLIFTFSPIQEFIKASRKFLDFWAGSYLLHYLSVKVCWYIAHKYGPDAVITPSLWSQEIIDALMVEKYFDFGETFQNLVGSTPGNKWESKESNSLSTAGFPNVIVALVPGKEAAIELGKELVDCLKSEWKNLGDRVKEKIKQQVIETLTNEQEKVAEMLREIFPNQEDLEPYLKEVKKLEQGGVWTWNKLWDAQLNNTWEPYWTAIPLGSDRDDLAIDEDDNKTFNDDWKKAQSNVAQTQTTLPSKAEEKVYTSLNVGTWWGSLQYHLGECIATVKNTRVWNIPAAPGERSTLSGKFSAVHPKLHYEDVWREGWGLPASDLRLFWSLMSVAFPGLFNGSEKMNAIELTKRMAWQYGGVAESLGIKIDTNSNEDIDYEKLIRFPNLSSIAAARFACDRSDLVKQYWHKLRQLIDNSSSGLNKEQIESFYKRSQRAFNVPKTEESTNQTYNGAMFSSKWLADDMGLEGEALSNLRGLVDTAHKQMGWGDFSPADWWAIVLADGEGMGGYVRGEKLKNYDDYINQERVDKSFKTDGLDNLMETKKRMGPATHIGFNRALLDFSNRLVPYITEKRFCGKGIYSGGDDVMSILPLADLPEYLISLRACWCGAKTDPYAEKDPNIVFESQGGYWQPRWKNSDGKKSQLPDRPLFTMGEGATISAGVVIAYKTVPLPTVLESLWVAEKDRAKKLPGKDGLCFRVIYGGGNQLEALMKGELLASWWEFVNNFDADLSPLLYRLAEELPQRACLTENYQLFSKAAGVIVSRRDKQIESVTAPLLRWIEKWESWAFNAINNLAKSRGKMFDSLSEEETKSVVGSQPQDLGMLLRFSAFWIDKQGAMQKVINKKKGEK